MGGVRVALLGAAILAAGVIFGSEPLLPAGIALLALPVLLSTWGWLSARGARIDRAALPVRVEEGAGLDGTLLVRTGLLPLVARVEDPILPGPLPIRRLRPLHRFDVKVRVRPLGRGRHRLAPPTLRIGDPLGVFSHETRGSGSMDLLVLPRIEPLLSPSGAGGGSLGLVLEGVGDRSRPTGRESPAEPHLDGLRPYRPGSSASRIHWPALARHDELLERRLVHPGAGGPIVALDPSGTPDSETLDRAVRAAASLCFHLAKRGGCELVLPGRPGRHSIGAGLEGWREAHTALALVEEAAGGLDLARVDAGGAMFLVRASVAGSAPLPSTAGYLLTPEPVDRGASAFSVAGCHATALGAGGARTLAAAG